MWKLCCGLFLLAIISNVRSWNNVASVVQGDQYQEFDEEDNQEQTVWAPYPPLVDQCPDLDIGLLEVDKEPTLFAPGYLLHQTPGIDHLELLKPHYSMT